MTDKLNGENKTPLTYPTVIAGAVAAATATVLSTRLGLVGTVLGAVVASMVSTLVSTVFVRWLERMHRTTRDRDPRPWQRLAIGVTALGLVVLAFHTGVSLLTAGLPRDTFSARLLAQIGIG
jgi:H+/Cl- antiporter ClcA